MIADDLFSEAESRALQSLVSRGALSRLPDQPEALMELHAVTERSADEIERAAAGQLRGLDDAINELDSLLSVVAAQRATGGEPLAARLVEALLELAGQDVAIPDLERQAQTASEKVERAQAADDAKAEEAATGAPI